MATTVAGTLHDADINGYIALCCNTAERIQITAFDADLSTDETVNQKARTWAVVAVNGLAGSEGAFSESELTPFTQEEFEEIAAESPLSWVRAGDTISLAGSQIRGQSSWWYLTLAVLIFLLAELLILAWPKMTETNNAASSAT